MEREEVRDRLIRLLRQHAGDRTAINDETGINGTHWRDNLGIDGADAWELLENISTEFRIDVGDFPFTKYFGAERANLILPFSLVVWAFGLNKTPKLTVGGLIDYIYQKRMSRG